MWTKTREINIFLIIWISQVFVMLLPVLYMYIEVTINHLANLYKILQVLLPLFHKNLICYTFKYWKMELRMKECHSRPFFWHLDMRFQLSEKYHHHIRCCYCHCMPGTLLLMVMEFNPHNHLWNKFCCCSHFTNECIVLCFWKAECPWSPSKKVEELV
jgi:hypothetical protein